MKLIFNKNKKYILKFKKGEEFIEKLTDFCIEKNVKAAWFQGIGAGDKADISFYNLKTQKYANKVFKEEFEILSLIGNVALADGKIIVHAHISLGKKDFETFGGHLNKLWVAGTCEIFLEAFGGEFKREQDKETGLKLLK
ncbi:DNA-binding protein [Candidatus Microgenomates bacterium]|nr:MAG: DNA-binding protein [Candidatus Microgenomates bacterium]